MMLARKAAQASSHERPWFENTDPRRKTPASPSTVSEGLAGVQGDK
jgi:hypothetical protein